MKNEKDGVRGASRLQNAFGLGKEGRVCLVSAKKLATSSATLGDNNLYVCFQMIR